MHVTRILTAECLAVLLESEQDWVTKALRVVQDFNRSSEKVPRAGRRKLNARVYFWAGTVQQCNNRGFGSVFKGLIASTDIFTRTSPHFFRRTTTCLLSLVLQFEFVAPSVHASTKLQRCCWICDCNSAFEIGDYNKKNY